MKSAAFASLLALTLALAGCTTTGRTRPAAAPKTETPSANLTASGQPALPTPVAIERIPQPLQPPPPPAPAAPVQRVVSLYLEIPAEPRAGFAEDLTAALNDELRRLGYDLRNTATATSKVAVSLPAPVSPLLVVARELAAGTPPPGNVRAATYLHTNSPRWVCIATFVAAPAPPGKSPAGHVLAALLCDTATGNVRWSGHVASTSDNFDNARAQRLASELLRTAPRVAEAKH